MSAFVRAASTGWFQRSPALKAEPMMNPSATALNCSKFSASIPEPRSRRRPHALELRQPRPGSLLICVRVLRGSSEDEMIAATERGILVTRVWYIREVDPYEKIFTGMTRDGTFLVEGGRVAGGLRNFRFNAALMEALSNVEAIGPAVRVSGEETFDMVAPPMKVRDFNLTEVTRF